MAINWQLRSYTEEEFRKAWASSTSLSGVARELGVRKSGTSINAIRTAGIELGLDKSHFIRPTNRRKFDLDEILVEDSEWYGGAQQVLTLLVAAGLKERKCEHCQIRKWQDAPLTHQLDHINGVRTDYRFENLAVLCPNCHSQTPTWGNKARGGSRVVRRSLSEVCGCGNPCSPGATKCASCRDVAVRASRALAAYDTETLTDGIRRLGYLGYSRLLPVSDNGLRKELRSRGIDPKTITRSYSSVRPEH